jgi:hypothetical protein
MKILPITDVVVEDVQVGAKKGCKVWNINFSPIEVGKNWFYNLIEDLGLILHLRLGYETKQLREKFNLKKDSRKSERIFATHAVDAWVMAASVTGVTRPTWKGLFYWIPTRFHRRSLHMLQPSVGGIRRQNGGTRSLGLSRGTLVKHVKYGLCYIGGNLKGRVSLHSTKTSKRLTQEAKLSDCHILTKLSWIVEFR